VLDHFSDDVLASERLEDKDALRRADRVNIPRQLRLATPRERAKVAN
jgi:hypothetical protein